MFLLVTGGTGYVGSHAVAALTKAGHGVRILARSPGRVSDALAPLGASGVETRVGEVTDPVAVEGALDGCEAVLHAASVFSMDPRRADEMRSVNVRGTDTVLGTAHRLGLDPIVYVSSELALLPSANGQVLATESPVGRSRWPYCRSKAASELVARRYQDAGAPVVSVMPAAVWGPHDPHFGEGVTLATNVLKRRIPVVPPGGMHIADVRDVAAALAAVMEPRRGQRRYLGTTSRCPTSSERSPTSATVGFHASPSPRGFSPRLAGRPTSRNGTCAHSCHGQERGSGSSTAPHIAMTPRHVRSSGSRLVHCARRSQTRFVG
jgi:nucleoside-diphosphate-sugar epimerase